VLGQLHLAVIGHVDVDEICARPVQQVAGRLAVGEDMPLGVGFAEPKNGIRVGEPHEAPAAAVIDCGDKSGRLSGAGGRTRLDRSCVRIGLRGGRNGEADGKGERGKAPAERQMIESDVCCLFLFTLPKAGLPRGLALEMALLGGVCDPRHTEAKDGSSEPG